MKKLFISAALFAFVSAISQEITLDKIYSGYYRGKGIAGITSMKNGESYLVIEQGGIAKYSYKTSQKEGNLVDGNFESYEFSDDESKILLLKDSQPIYRHSFLGIFDVKDLKTGKVFFAFNTHFDHIGKEARRQSAHLLLKSEGNVRHCSGNYNWRF